MGPFFTKFGLPLAACIALLGSRFVAPGVSALPNLRYANTSKQASAVEVTVIAAFDKQADVITAACSVCDQAVHLPTGGFELQTDKQCVPKCCTYDCENCRKVLGQKVCAPVPCSGCQVDPCGEACTDVPTGVEAEFDDVTMCDAATRFPEIVLGSDKITEAIDKAQRMCPCIKDLPSYLSEFSVADFRTAALAGSAKLFDCLTTQGLDIKDEEGDDLSEAGGDKIIRAPEVGMELYVSLSVAAVGCGVGFGSTCDTIITLLLKFFKDSASTVGTGLADWLEEYLMGGVIDSVLGPLEQATRAADPVAAVQTQLQGCAVTGKGDAGVASAQAAVTELQQAVAALNKQLVDAKALQQSMTAAVQGVRAMADAAGKSYEQHLMDAVQGLMTGDLSGTFVDLIGFMGKTDDMTRVFSDVQTFTSNMQQLQGDIEAVQPAVAKAQQALAALQKQEASPTWQGPWTTTAGGGGRTTCPVDGGASLAAIQTPLQSVQAAAASVQNRLAQLDVANLQMDVATINRHFELSADLPCTTTGTVSIGPDDMALEFDVPQFYVCRTEVTVPMPNEFIPYIRIKGGAAK